MPRPCKILLVPGTFEMDEAVTVPGFIPWWDERSEFYRDLTEFIGEGTCSIEHVDWSTQNWDSHRMKGADALQALVGQYAPDHDIALIGFSHGGSVIEDVLRRPNQPAGDQNPIKVIATVGAPFLVWHSKPIVRGLGWLLIVAVIALTLFLASLSQGRDPSGIMPSFVMSQSILFLAAAFASLFFWLFPRFWPLSWLVPQLSPRRRRTIPPELSRRFLALYHADDEAISTMKKIARGREDFDIRLKPGLWGHAFLAYTIIAAASYFSLDQVTMRWAALGFGGTGTCDSLECKLGILFIPAVILSPVISSLVNIGIRRFFQISVSGSVKRLAFGNDDPSRKVHEVKPLPDAGPTYWAEPLAKELAELIRQHAHSNLHTGESITKFRSQLTKRREDPFSMSVFLTEVMRDVFPWSSLVHSSYFDTPEFRRFLVFCLGQHGIPVNWERLAGPESRDPASSSRLRAYGRWYEETFPGRKVRAPAALAAAMIRERIVI